jgi:hypothetical protein
MPKGVPKNQKLIDEMLYRLCKLELREKDSRDSQDTQIGAIKLTDKAHQSWTEDLSLRLMAAEKRIAEMNEAFSRASFPRAQIPTLTDAVQ